MRTHLIHRPARDIFPPQGRFEFPPIGYDLARLSCRCRSVIQGPAELGAVHPHAVHDAANRRASATIAFFIPQRLAICIAQALSHDHFLERIMA